MELLPKMILHNWTLISYQGINKNHHYWLCSCNTCGATQLIDSATLKKSNSNIKCKNCGTEPEYTLLGWQLDDKYNKVAGLLTKKRERLVVSYTEILNYLLAGKRIKNAILLDDTTVILKSLRMRKDYTDKQIDKLHVLEYIGQGPKSSQTSWLCQCDCGNKVVVGEVTLGRKQPHSCSVCRNVHLRKDRIATPDWTPIEYDHTGSAQEHCPSYWKYKCNYCGKIVVLNATKVDSELQIPRCECQYQHSKFEDDIYNYVSELYKDTIERNTRKVIAPNELDVYLPKKNLAIECNGDYWHSAEAHTNTYHQNKTQDCAKHNIHLIHIFEYEWVANKKKLQTYLKAQLLQPERTFYARQCEIKRIDNQTALDFCDKYHLQNGISCLEAYGLYNKDELLMVMTFGMPRFNDNYDTELLRLCIKEGINVVGGAGKLFNAYITKHPKETIMSYCNLAKFTGKVYETLQFKYLYTTEPNYVYVKHKTVLTRYQCQKHKLVEQGFDENMSESQIMRQRGFNKIYDCGNAVYLYEPKSTT